MHRVTNTHFAAARSAYGCSGRMRNFLGRMVLLKNGSDQVSVPVLAVVREEEGPRCFIEMQTHTASYRARRC